MNANKVTLCWPNRADQATLSLGSWEATLPLNNLKNRVIAKKARTTNAAEANTKFNAALDKARSVYAVALAGHNLSASAKWRIRYYADYARTQLKFDSGGEEALSLSRLNTTGTRWNSGGNLEIITQHLPRWDYDPATLAFKGLKIEGQRQNLVVQTEAMTTSPWVVSGITVTPNVLTTKGLTFARISTPSVGVLFQPVTFTGNGTKCMACYFKQDGSNAGTFSFQLWDNTASAYRGGATGTIASDGTITAVGSNGGTVLKVENIGGGVYRILVRAPGIVAANVNRVYVSDSGGVTVSSFLAAGAQAEDAQWPSSYIPNVTSINTRSADDLTMLLNLISNLVAANGYTVRIKARVPSEVLAASTEYPGVFKFHDGTSNNRAGVFIATDADYMVAYVTTGGAGQVNEEGADFAVTGDVSFNMAARVKPNAFAMAVNGGNVRTDNTVTMPSVTTAWFGRFDGHLYGWIEAIDVYGPELTDAQVQTLSNGGAVSATPYLSWNAANLSLNTTIGAGRQSVWPSFFEYEQLEWEDDNFWFGNDELDNALDYTALAVMFADDIKTDVRAVLVEIFDSTNDAGYIEAGRLFVGTGWQPEFNAEYGMQFNHEIDTKVEEALDGTEYYDRKRPKRVAAFQLANMQAADAFSKVFAAQRDQGIDKEVLFAYEPAAGAYFYYRTFLGRMKQADPIATPYYERWQAPITIKEII